MLPIHTYTHIHIVNSNHFIKFLNKPHEPDVVVYALIAALLMEWQVDFCEFSVSLAYQMSRQRHTVRSHLKVKAKINKLHRL